MGVICKKECILGGPPACEGDGERGGGQEQSEEMVETLRVQQGVWQMQLAVGRAARSLSRVGQTL